MVNIPAISTGLKLEQDGIWYGPDKQKVSYPDDGNTICFAIEDHSFWFKHRNQCIASMAQSYPPENRGTIFDIGGGNGFVASGLMNAGFDVVLVEPNHAGALNAKRRGLENIICATTDSARFHPHSLDAIGLFDVLEHIDDDLSFLTSLKTLLKQGGRLYLTVPAYASLWSGEDVFAGHLRRYTLNTVCKAVTQAGLDVEFCSYIFRFLPIPIALFRALPYRLGLSGTNSPAQNTIRDHTAKKGILSRITESLLHREIENLNHLRRMSFGSTCLLVATNSGSHQ